METKKHYIAYMDILGYSAYIAENPDKANEYLQTIANAIEKVKRNVAGLSLVGKKRTSFPIFFICFLLV